MTIVERRRFKSNLAWGKPLKDKCQFEVELVGASLQVSAILSATPVDDNPCDPVLAFAVHPKTPWSTEATPEIAFANARSDEELIAFVRAFGPVEAATVTIAQLEEGQGYPGGDLKLTAIQDMNELRKEASIFRAALELIGISNRTAEWNMAADGNTHESVQGLVRDVVKGIKDWPAQWDRERAQRNSEPSWRLSSASLNRIENLSACRPDPLLPPLVDCRIVISELLNCFSEKVFPNYVEAHSHIKYGIRPLLYSILRRQFVGPREFASCANSHCRKFFNIDRAGRKFCCAECSRKQRQRIYWKRAGKAWRKKRSRS